MVVYTHEEFMKMIEEKKKPKTKNKVLQEKELKEKKKKNG